MKPFGNIVYIARRIGELLRLKNIDKIAPEVEELEKPRIEAPSRPVSPAGKAGERTPASLPEGQYLGRSMAGAGMVGE